jgi:hypothetical protein
VDSGKFAGEERPMERLLDTHYEFITATGVKARCGLRILRDGSQVVVILSELRDNRGRSVTNAAEEIATQVRRKFGLDPDQTRWIERYPERQRFRRNRDRSEPDVYDEILYVWDEYRATEPEWRRLAPDEVQRMVGDGDS